MPELRRDSITNTWVIIATERSKRPSDFAPPKEANGEAKDRPDNCPFCPGHEQQTPPEVLAYREQGERDTPGWLVRVIPNKFPALSTEEDVESHTPAPSLYTAQTGAGVHEVIVESPEHHDSWADYGLDQATLALQAWAERYRDLRNDNRLAYAQIFVNHGSAAGASRAHPHSQLIATPMIPAKVMEELDGAAGYYREHKSCLYCTLAAAEIREESRLVSLSDDFLAFCPYASRFPMEIWILPRQHQADFAEITLSQIQELAGILRKVLRSLAFTAGDPPYNAVLHTLPYQGEGYEQSYHWHLEILPRLTTMAGFEWGTGMFINPTPPEEASRYLRKNPELNPNQQE
ncbi:MAG: galactose-1-phosphate uridylyltransferase [Clostridia bacterium]|nr:MAG: galactose-1-phosphate uridylyltransferase [Clostridia bacterium]